MNSIQSHFKGKAFTLAKLREIAGSVTNVGEITNNAKKHGRKTKWSRPIEMYLPCYVSVAEANPDKAEEGDYYAYIGWHPSATGIQVWVPKDQQKDGYVDAQFKVRYRPTEANAFVFGTNTKDLEKNLVARVRRIYKSLANDNPAKAEIARAFREERVLLVKEAARRSQEL